MDVPVEELGGPGVDGVAGACAWVLAGQLIILSTDSVSGGSRHKRRRKLLVLGRDSLQRLVTKLVMQFWKIRKENLSVLIVTVFTKLLETT